MWKGLPLRWAGHAVGERRVPCSAFPWLFSLWDGDPSFRAVFPSEVTLSGKVLTDILRGEPPRKLRTAVYLATESGLETQGVSPHLPGS